MHAWMYVPGVALFSSVLARAFPSALNCTAFCSAPSAQRQTVSNNEDHVFVFFPLKTGFIIWYREQVVQMHVHSSYLHRMTALYAIQVLTESLDVDMLSKVCITS